MVLVAAEGVFQHFGKLVALDNVGAALGFDFIAQQFFEPSTTCSAKKILAGLIIAYGTGVSLWVAHSFIQALITEHIRVDLTIGSYVLVILLVFLGASSVAIGVWYQHHPNWAGRVVMAVAAAITIALVYASTAVDSSRLIISLTFLAMWSVPPLAIGTYLLKPVR